MPASRPIVVWFRRDLRLADNPALLAAQATGRPVIPLFILDETGTVRPLGAAARWWLDKSLAQLGASLQSLGGGLTLRRGPSGGILEDFVEETGAAGVYWNRLYDGRSVARDGLIKASLVDRGLECRSFNAGLLNEPWEIASAAGGPYRVFTPYWRAARPMAALASPEPAPKRVSFPAAMPRTDALSAWRLHPRRPDWSGGFSPWRPGERGAQRRLDDFLERRLPRYASDRNSPGLEGTSTLSPHLAFGEIGPRQIWAATQAAAASGAPSGDAESFLRELGWREFNYHILFHHPEVISKSFKPAFDEFPWRVDAPGFRAWRRGRTGYPLVDAGMRQLWATGWMHNRVRMVTASFLTKHLGMDWRLGEAWFWDTLVDADLANNVAGWQWVAGCGADAAPYFRIFNPTLQAEKFDLGGDYVRRWVPELSVLSDAEIHQPWRFLETSLLAKTDDLEQPYPRRIVDHAMARARALDAYRSLTL